MMKFTGVVVLLLLMSLAVGHTDAEVQWYLAANMPGVCSECPETIAFYKERLDAMENPQVYWPTIGLKSEPKEYEEVLLLNMTHNLVIVHTIDSLGRAAEYNVTRWVNPPEPEQQAPVVVPVPVSNVTQTVTLEERISALEARIAALETRIAELEASR